MGIKPGAASAGHLRFALAYRVRRVGLKKNFEFAAGDGRHARRRP